MICIDINLRTPLQLFDVRDPAPFIERDLDDDAVDYIVSSAEEFSLRTPIKLVLHFSDGVGEGLPARQIERAIHSYFEYQAELLRKKSERMLKLGRLYGLVGTLFLFTCLFLAELTSQIQAPTLGRILREGLIITGWVALWRPIQLFLYDWVPSYEKRRYFEKLARIGIDIRSRKTTAR